MRAATPSWCTAVEWMRDKAAVRNFLAPEPHPEPAIRRSSETGVDGFLRSTSR